MHWSLQRSNITRTHCLIYSAVLIQLQISNRSRGLIVHKNRLKAYTRGGHQTVWMPGLSEVIEKGVTKFDRFPPSGVVRCTTNNTCFMTKSLLKYEVLWKLKSRLDRGVSERSRKLLSFSLPLGHWADTAHLERFLLFDASLTVDVTQHQMESK